MDENVAIRAEHVSKTFRLPHEKSGSVKTAVINLKRKRTYEKQQVLNDISFEVKQGEFFGIVGRNGSGKSTLLKMLARIYLPSKGTIHINGKLTPFIELGVGFNPELTGRENVFLNGALLGFNRKEMTAMYKDIVEFAELERFMEQKLKNYSSGMQVRLAFSIAIRAKSDILVLDEVLAVGDYDFQQKCFEYFKHLKKVKKTVVLVSHDINNIRQFCTKGIHIHDGRLAAYGDIEDVIDSYSKENIERAGMSLESSGEGKKISGSGDVTIDQVFTKDSSGEKKDVFTPGEDIQVCFKVKANKDIESPVYGMIFSDSSGKVAFATNTLDQKIKTKDLKKGETAVITYKLQNNYDDSLYVVSGAVANSDRTTLFARLENAHTFKSAGRNVSARAPYYPEHAISITTKS